MKELKDYAMQRGPSLPLRVFAEDKPRFDDLQRRMTVASGGIPFSQAQVIRYLLDLAEGMERLIGQEKR